MVPGAPRGPLGAAATAPGCRTRPRILDAGCGTGRNLVEFARSGRPRASTSRPRRSRSATGAGWPACAQARIEELPFEDGALRPDPRHRRDRAHARTTARRWRSCAAWPRRTRALIVTVPAYEWLWSHHDERYHHYRRYTRADAAPARRPRRAGEPRLSDLLQHARCCRRSPSCGRCRAAGRQRQRQVGLPAHAGPAEPLARAADARRGELIERGASAARRRVARHGMPIGMSARPVASSSCRSTTRRRTSPELHRAPARRRSPRSGGYELVYVDDGSTDGSAAMIEGWARRGRRRRARAAVAQLRHGDRDVRRARPRRGDYVVLMHADLQDPPELIPEMLRAWREEGADVVFARRIGRDESRAQARAGHGLLQDDGAARARALPGPGGRLPADVAAGGRHAARDARAAPLPARDGRLGRLRAGADRVPPRGRAGRRAAPRTRRCSGWPSRR